VVIGSSTGGPPALEAVLKCLDTDFPAPILVAQHMPPTFTQSLAQRLDQLCPITVVHAEQGMPLQPGTVYIGAGGKHLRAVRGTGGRSVVDISTKPEEALYRPCVNVLFESAAELFGGKGLGVMLTGMGEDGLLGSQKLVAAGGLLLGQDESSCVVYGMPKAVQEAGLVTAQLPPAELGRALLTVAAAKPRPTAAMGPTPGPTPGPTKSNVGGSAA
jgi:two-component system chemotaxis response regulator CheB